MEQHTRNVEEQLQAFSEGSLIDLLDITFVEATQDRLVLQMPVQPKTHQPAGILHGGASVVLAETAASLGTALLLFSRKRQHPWGPRSILTKKQKSRLVSRLTRTTFAVNRMAW